MKEFIVTRYSKDEKLQLAEVAEPVIGENDVLIRVHAAGVNLLDSMIKKGGDLRYSFPIKRLL